MGVPFRWCDVEFAIPYYVVVPAGEQGGPFCGQASDEFGIGVVAVPRLRQAGRAGRKVGKFDTGENIVHL